MVRDQRHAGSERAETRDTRNWPISIAQVDLAPATLLPTQDGISRGWVALPTWLARSARFHIPKREFKPGATPPFLRKISLRNDSSIFASFRRSRLTAPSQLLFKQGGAIMKTSGLFHRRKHQPNLFSPDFSGLSLCKKGPPTKRHRAGLLDGLSSTAADVLRPSATLPDNLPALPNFASPSASPSRTCRALQEIRAHRVGIGPVVLANVCRA